MFDTIGDSAAQSFPKKSLAAGLLFSATVACLLCYFPPSNNSSWSGLASLAAGRVLLVLGAFAVTVRGLTAISPEVNRARTLWIVLLTSRAAVWLAPLALLFWQRSLWAAAIAIVFVASLTSAYRSLQDTPTDSYADDQQFIPFHLADSSLWYRQLLLAVCAVLLAEAGIASGYAGYPAAATILVGLSAALYARLFIARVPQSEFEVTGPRESALRIAVHTGLAVMVTAVCLLPATTSSNKLNGVRFLFGGHARYGFSPLKEVGDSGRSKAAQEGEFDFAQAHSGIILWPEKPMNTTVIAPSPLLGSNFLSGSHSSNPMVIPFTGVYWYYRTPDVRPPSNSRQIHGSPERLTARSTDRRVLSMEAYQHFGNLINLDCCSRIEIAIRNADRYPDSVSLELILINTSLPGKPSESLGGVIVKSTPPWQLYGERPVVRETLNFTVPSEGAIRSFDEIKVVFHLEAQRAEFGAKIGIDRFVLVPRGL